MIELRKKIMNSSIFFSIFCVVLIITVIPSNSKSENSWEYNSIRLWQSTSPWYCLVNDDFLTLANSSKESQISQINPFDIIINAETEAPFSLPAFKMLNDRLDQLYANYGFFKMSLGPRVKFREVDALQQRVFMIEKFVLEIPEFYLGDEIIKGSGLRIILDNLGNFVGKITFMPNEKRIACLIPARLYYGNQYENSGPFIFLILSGYTKDKIWIIKNVKIVESAFEGIKKFRPENIELIEKLKAYFEQIISSSLKEEIEFGQNIYATYYGIDPFALPKHCCAGPWRCACRDCTTDRDCPWTCYQCWRFGCEECTELGCPTC